jgi:uncharacterized membrane-anchored protein
MSIITDHPLRYELSNELHARPFPTIEAPCRAAYLAVKPAENAAGRDRQTDFDHLLNLLDLFGAQHPNPGATHYFGRIGRHFLKWESHTEFVTYTIFGTGVAERPFDASTFTMLPEEWLAELPGTRITSALVRVEQLDGDEGIAEKLNQWFVPESVAVSRVLDNQFVVASDFRIDGSGHMRIAMFARPEAGATRTGRVLQRLCEVETYKSISMLGLARVRSLNPQLAGVDKALSLVVSDMCNNSKNSVDTLNILLSLSAELENIVAQNYFRFGATGAYEAIVNQRIKVLREERFQGRQTLAEFMMRRFDPAMRTVKSAEARLSAMSDRATRAAELLRTRVDVEHSAQNQELLASMDKRADTQLRLQRTVEGLSVVAISYYAVSLVLYVVGPLENTLGISKSMLAAVTTPVVIYFVWVMVRRVRSKLE